MTWIIILGLWFTFNIGFFIVCIWGSRKVVKPNN